MRHFLVDTNVVLDLLAQRAPFVSEAIQLFEAAAQQRVTLYVTSLSFSHLHYIIRKATSSAKALEMLTDLLPLVQVAAVDATAVQQALTTGFPDFEDALQYFAAAAVPAITAIVTRDPKGFRAGTLPILTPAEAVAQSITVS